MEIERACDKPETPRDSLAGLWVPRMVEARLIEAVQVAQYTAGSVGPRGYGSGLPSELIAILGQPEGNGEDPWWLLDSYKADPEKRARRAIKASAVTRMEEAIRWPTLYLGGWDGPRRVLALWLRCKVYRKPFDEACKRRQWARATAYRARDRAFGLIAQGLNRDGVSL